MIVNRREGDRYIVPCIGGAWDGRFFARERGQNRFYLPSQEPAPPCDDGVLRDARVNLTTYVVYPLCVGQTYLFAVPEGDKNPMQSIIKVLEAYCERSTATDR